MVDERSAVYFAIGLYLQCGEPIVCSCTSAQATRNYIPGLTEAYYKSDLDEADAYDIIVEQNKPKTVKNLVKKALKGIIK